MWTVGGGGAGASARTANEEGAERLSSRASEVQCQVTSKATVAIKASNGSGHTAARRTVRVHNVLRDDDVAPALSQKLLHVIASENVVVEHGAVILHRALGNFLGAGSREALRQLRQEFGSEARRLAGHDACVWRKGRKQVRQQSVSEVGMPSEASQRE